MLGFVLSVPRFAHADADFERIVMRPSPYGFGTELPALRAADTEACSTSKSTGVRSHAAVV